MLVNSNTDNKSPLTEKIFVPQSFLQKYPIGHIRDYTMQINVASNCQGNNDIKIF